MASSKITDLTAITAPDDADLAVIEDTSVPETKKMTWAYVKSVLKTYFDTVYGTEVVDEAMGGSGVNRTIAYAPIAGTLKVYDGTVRLHLTTDFTQSGTAITFIVAPDTPYADYRH